jgi:hypothetical protein
MIPESDAGEIVLRRNNLSGNVTFFVALRAGNVRLFRHSFQCHARGSTGLPRTALRQNNREACFEERTTSGALTSPPRRKIEHFAALVDAISSTSKESE